MDMNKIRSQVKVAERGECMARVATWNFQVSVVKPRQGSSESKRGEGGVGFLVEECLARGVELIREVDYEESTWIKVKGERGRNTLFLGCVYMSTVSENVSVIESSYRKLKEDVLRIKERGQVVLQGDVNARMGKSSELDKCNRHVW